jgi:uncharacterized OsmC-like protein
MKNIRIEDVRAAVKKAETDPKAVQVPFDIIGEWRTDESLPQFGGKVKLSTGEDVLFESDFPPWLGGQGRKPSPLAYCFWGGMACFASTFALTAASEGIEVRNFSVRSSGLIDFHQGLGIGNQPPISGLRWEVRVESEASQEDLERLLSLAEERCPASWMLKNVVPLEAVLVKA